MSLRRRVGWGMVAVAVGAIGGLTLTARPELAPLSEATPVWCLVCGSQGAVDVLLNVLLFVPLGVGLGLAGVRPRRAVLVAAIATLAIELLQLRVIAGRDASLSDLLTNTTGAGLGFWLSQHWRAMILPSPPGAARLAGGWAILVLAITGMTAASIAPSMPGPPYWGQWTPELGGFAQHAGRVDSARVEDIAVPGGRRLRDSRALGDSLADGELDATVFAVLAAPVDGIAPIFRLVDGDGHQALLIAQTGTDLLVETGTRSERFRLRPVTVMFEHVLDAAGEAVRIDVESNARVYRVRAGDTGGGRTLELTRSASWGWALLLPFNTRVDEHRRVFDAVWMGALLLPLGWWSGRVSRPLLAVGAGVLLLAVALAGLPALFGLAASAAGAWLGGLGGLVTGAVCAGLAVRGHRDQGRRT